MRRVRDDCSRMPTLNKQALRIVALIAWLCFAASFLLPAVGGPGGPMYGWQAFSYVFGVCSEMFRSLPPRIDEPAFLAFPPANVFALFVPLILWQRPHWGAYFGWPILFGGLVSLIRFGVSDKDLRTGYYLWVVSLLVLGTLCLLHSGWKFWRAFELRD